jgi:DNA-directed RNA polymerase specialized sigma24 family protein
MTEQEFTQHYKNWKLPMMAIAGRIVGFSNAADVVQDAFIRFAKMEGDNPERALKLITVRMCINYKKMMSRRPYVIGELDPELHQTTEMRSELAFLIASEIAELTSGQQKIAKLLWLGYNSVDISEILNISQSTVRVQIFKFKKVFEPAYKLSLT